MINLASLSGGKDSTAMVIKAREKGLRFDEYIFCDTGVEFPEMYIHLDKLEKYLDINIIRIQSKKSFEHYMLHHVKKNGTVGYSWPDMSNRWCTQLLKKNQFSRAITQVKNKYNCNRSDIIEFHGIAIDEKHRANKNNEKNIRYPLIEWSMTEAECLQYCYNHGFDWSGLYEKFDRVSCWCCPLSNKKELAVLKFDYPGLWDKMLEWDAQTWRKFKPGKTLAEL